MLLEQFTLKRIVMQLFFYRDNFLGFLNGRYATDRRSHLYNYRSNIFDSRLWTKCYLKGYCLPAA